MTANKKSALISKLFNIRELPFLFNHNMTGWYIPFFMNNMMDQEMLACDKRPGNGPTTLPPLRSTQPEPLHHSSRTSGIHGH